MFIVLSYQMILLIFKQNCLLISHQTLFKQCFEFLGKNLVSSCFTQNVKFWITYIRCKSINLKKIYFRIVYAQFHL